MLTFIRFILLAMFIGATPLIASATSIVTIERTTTTQTTSSIQYEIQNTLNSWTKALSTGSSDAVLKLYADNAILLPTFSKKIHDTPSLRKAYFDHLITKQNLKAVINDLRIQVYGNVSVANGLYTFSYVEHGEKITIPARFTFVYLKTPSGWLIVDHHSSKMP